MAFIFLRTLEIDSMASFGAGRWDAIGQHIHGCMQFTSDDYTAFTAVQQQNVFLSLFVVVFFARPCVAVHMQPSWPCGVVLAATSSPFTPKMLF